MGWRDAQWLRALGTLEEDLGLFFMSGSSQPPVTPAPVDPTASSSLHTRVAHTQKHTVTKIKRNL